MKTGYGVRPGHGEQEAWNMGTAFGPANILWFENFLIDILPLPISRGWLVVGRMGEEPADHYKLAFSFLRDLENSGGM